MVGAVSLALLVGGGGAAVAATEDDDSTQEVADLIAEVAPDQGDVVEGESSPDGVTAEIGALAVTIPSDADAAVVLDAGRSSLQVTLPTEVNADASEVADDGTVVYEGDDATAAAQVLEDGSVRLQTVTESADGPHEFTYTFGENVVPVEKADGTGVELVEEHDGFAMTVGEVAPAWAVDANGDEVATSYEIQGNALVQVIDASADATYPVVADPKVTNAWWNTTIYFNKSETGKLGGRCRRRRGGRSAHSRPHRLEDHRRGCRSRVRLHRSGPVQRQVHQGGPVRPRRAGSLAAVQRQGGWEVLPMNHVALVVAAFVTGAGVGVLTQVSRRKATWPWRVGAASTGLAGVAALFAATGGNYLIPMLVFVTMVVVSYAFDRREPRTAPQSHSAGELGAGS